MQLFIFLNVSFYIIKLLSIVQRDDYTIDI